MKVKRQIRLVAGMMACLGWASIAAAAPSDSLTTTTLARTADGRGVEVVSSRDLGDIDALVREALDEYARLHPDAVDFTMTAVRHEPDGSLGVLVLPYDAGYQLMSSPGEPPGLPGPPPGYPGTPDQVTRVDFHQFQNGYTRDTRYQRDQNIVDGRIVNGPWWVSRDIIEYTGGGGGGGSTTCGTGAGQIPCPKQD